MYDNLKCPFLWNCFLPVLLPTEGFLLNNFDLTEFLQVGCKKCGRVFFFFLGGGGGYKLLGNRTLAFWFGIIIAFFIFKKGKPGT